MLFLVFMISVMIGPNDDTYGHQYSIDLKTNLDFRKSTGVHHEAYETLVTTPFNLAKNLMKI